MTETDGTDNRRLPLTGAEVPSLTGEHTQFDEALGRRMARDARLVSNSDLSEAEFHEKYHDAVVEEFGRDDRPLQTEECS